MTCPALQHALRFHELPCDCDDGDDVGSILRLRVAHRNVSSNAPSHTRTIKFSALVTLPDITKLSHMEG